MIAWLSLVPLAIGFNFFVRWFYNAPQEETQTALAAPYSHPDKWGTYRSNLYFGLKTKTAPSLMTGLAWYTVNDIPGVSKMRHTCELDDSVHFGWMEHDGRSYGKQKIVDSFHQTEMIIEYAKLWSNEKAEREAWSVDISASPSGSGKKKLALLYYFTYESSARLNLRRIEDSDFVGFSGWAPEIGNFAMAARKNNRLPAEMINFSQIEPSRVWTLHDLMQQKIRQSLQDAYMSLGQSIFSYTDLSSFVKLSSEGELKDSNTVAFQFLIPNDDASVSFVFAMLDDKATKKPLQELAKQAQLLEARKKSSSLELNQRLQSTFSIPKAFESFATYALANMMGGISYFHGDSVVQKGPEGVPQRTEMTSLFTDVPARPNFPRGFYWDSGFHNILIAKWDINLSMEILSHWMSKINEEGWVGREQILGDEARSRVSKEYITQNTEYSNPPAPILPILMITMQVTQQIPDDANFVFRKRLQDMYGHLKRHFGWFLANQRAKLLSSEADESEPFLFRWRGRSGHHTLTSGLDDYPRGDVPSEFELHVDLLSWMALLARSLGQMATALDITESDYDYDGIVAEAKANLLKYHWDDERGCFADCTVNDAGDALTFVPNTGYVSLFPMLFGLLDADDSRLPRIFDIIEDPNQLWSNYGIRSLSKSDPFYGKGDQYWTGPIWINLNYLIVSSLKKYYNEGPYAERANDIYTKLRKNLVRNMNSQYKKTAYIWEQYNDNTGAGQRSRPFAGWSALVVLIIAESYH